MSLSNIKVEDYFKFLWPSQKTLTLILQTVHDQKSKNIFVKSLEPTSNNLWSHYASQALHMCTALRTSKIKAANDHPTTYTKDDTNCRDFD